MFRKRRIQGKTDYKARMDLLSGGKPRIVARITNKYASAQYVESKESQDFVITAAVSKELLNFGLKEEDGGRLKSLPACSLTGYLLGCKIKGKGKKEEGILDIGLRRATKGARVYAVLKGLVDAGIKIPHDKSILPDEKKWKMDVSKIKQNIDKKFI